MNKEKELDEIKIIWLEDIDCLHYVRQSVVQPCFPKTKPSWSAGRVIGYSEGKEKRSYRRVFWLKSYDRDSGNKVYLSTVPSQAVDPKTIEVNEMGFSPGYWSQIVERKASLLSGDELKEKQFQEEVEYLSWVIRQGGKKNEEEN